MRAIQVRIPSPTYGRCICYSFHLTQERGGEVVTNLDEAEVWVVSDDILYKYERYCSNDPDHRVVGEAFITFCVRRNIYEENRVVGTGRMRGRYPRKYVC